MTIDPLTGEVLLTQADYDEHNIQGLIELSYVKVANEVLAENMASLEEAISNTKDIMDTLTGLQNLHNKITTPAKPPFEFSSTNPGGFNYSTSNFAALKSAADAYYNASIDPVFSLTNGSSEFNTFRTDLVQLRTSLSAQIPLLSDITPTLAGGGADPNALLAKLKLVLKDLNDTLGTGSSPSYAAVKSWVEDKYSSLTGTDSTEAGKYQQNLTTAITAGQSLNDTQKETVRRYLFLFEEYYKSASAVLQKISQIIEKMGQNIAR